MQQRHQNVNVPANYLDVKVPIKEDKNVLVESYGILKSKIKSRNRLTRGHPLAGWSKKSIYGSC